MYVDELVIWLDEEVFCFDKLGFLRKISYLFVKMYKILSLNKLIIKIEWEREKEREKYRERYVDVKSLIKISL